MYEDNPFARVILPSWKVSLGVGKRLLISGIGLRKVEMATWEERNHQARMMGYEGESQRHRLRMAAQNDQLEAHEHEIRRLVDARESEGDPASIGLIFSDLLRRMGWTPGDDEPVIALRGIISP